MTPDPTLTERIAQWLFVNGKEIGIAVVVGLAMWAVYRDLARDDVTTDPRPERRGRRGR